MLYDMTSKSVAISFEMTPLCKHNDGYHISTTFMNFKLYEIDIGVYRLQCFNWFLFLCRLKERC